MIKWASCGILIQEMSRLFYDHLINLSKIEKLIKKHVKDSEARYEIYRLIDEIIHHRVIGCILDRLPKHHHKDFLNHVHKKPHDTGVLDYLKERLAEDVEEFIRQEIYLLGNELLELFVKPHEYDNAHKHNLH